MAKNKKNKSIVSDALKAAERQARLQAMADSGGRKAHRAATFAVRTARAARPPEAAPTGATGKG